MKAMRAKGRVVTLPEEPKGFLAEEAKQIQRQRQERKIVAGRKPPRPVPNYICYPEAFKNYDPKTGKWIGGRRGPLPKCRVCECTLHPEENHKCEGFKPKYVEHDEEWHERMEARREAIREAKFQRETPTCNLCGAELPTEEDYWAHGSECPML